MFIFSQTCQQYGVTAVVRVSEKTYDAKLIETVGIKFYVNDMNIYIYIVQLQ